jgi:hypothetical protein
MRRIKLVGVAILAVIALSAIASATASAEITLPTGFLPGAVGSPFTGTSGSGTLTAAEKGTIVCKKDKVTGTLTNATLATATVDFEECTVFGVIGAKSLEDAGSTILVKVNLHLCYIKKAAPKEVGVLTLVTTKDPTGIHVEVAGTLVEIKGEQVGKITPINAAAGKEFLILYTSSAVQCEGAPVKEELLAAENEGPFQAANEATDKMISFTTAQVLMAA